MVGLHWQLLKIHITYMSNDKNNASLHVLRVYCVSSTVPSTCHLVTLISLTTNPKMGYYSFKYKETKAWVNMKPSYDPAGNKWGVRIDDILSPCDKNR